jgi:hypothetical protein
LSDQNEHEGSFSAQAIVEHDADQIAGIMAICRHYWSGSCLSLDPQLVGSPSLPKVKFRRSSDIELWERERLDLAHFFSWLSRAVF